MPRPRTNKPRSPFAHRLILARESYGVATQRPGLDAGEFAAIIGIEAEAYRRYERGETKPKLDTLIKIRNTTGVTLDWLVIGDDRDDRASRPAPRPKLVHVKGRH